EPTHRTFSDIDLLLPHDQLDRANQALLTLGFRVDDAYLPSAHHHLPPLRSEDGRVLVELHHHVLPESNPYAIDMEQFRARSRIEQVAGIQARVLAPTDALLHACVHLAYAHRYLFYPLRHLVDILALTGRPEAQLD